MISDNLLASIETLALYTSCVVNRLPYFARGARYDTYTVVLWAWKLGHCLISLSEIHDLLDSNRNDSIYINLPGVRQEE
jgi:hypothetical protein